MKTVIEGHVYFLESSNSALHTLSFLHKQEIDGELRTVSDGTTEEEVLFALIDRLQFLQKQLPCRDKKYALEDLEAALGWLKSARQTELDAA